MKKVVIFGGSGFLGSYVADELIRRGFEVIIADLQKSKYLQDKQKFKKIDIFQPPILIRQPEVIRKAEKKAISIIQKLNKLGILKSQQPLMVSNLAERMVKTVKTNSKEKVNTYLPKEIFN